MPISGDDPEVKQRLQRTLARSPGLKNQVNATLIHDFYIFERNDRTSETFLDNHLKRKLLAVVRLSFQDINISKIILRGQNLEVLLELFRSRLMELCIHTMLGSSIYSPTDF